MVSDPLTDHCYGAPGSGSVESPMLIVCPNCATSYQVEAAALGAAGRSVRCSRCGTRWHASAEAPAYATAEAGGDAVAAFRSELGAPATGHAEPSAPLPETESPSIAAGEDPAGPPPGELPPEQQTSSDGAEPQPELSETSIPAADAPGVQPMLAADRPQPGDPATLSNDEPGDIESFAARRLKNAAARRRRRLLSIVPMAIFSLLAVIAGLIAMRGSIVKHAPQMASLYAAIGLSVNLRGLEFTGIKTTKDIHDGVPVLVVEGNIVNVAKVPVEVPRLRFAVRSDVGEIYAWTAQPTQPVISPGETLPFRSRLASPPNDTREVVVRFFNRRDAVAGMK